MAASLARLGRWCATHAGRVIAIWGVVLVALGVGALTLGSPMTSVVSIPDAPFQKVSEQLQRQIPQAAGGMGTVVIQSETGPFTDAQRAVISQVIQTWRSIDHVSAVVDPFVQQGELDGQGATLAAGKAKLDAAKVQLDTAQDQLDRAAGQLTVARSHIAQTEAQTPSDPSLPGLRAQVAEGEQRYAAGRAEWEAGLEQYREGRAAYDNGLTIHQALGDTRFVSADGTKALALVQFDTNTQSVPKQTREAIPATAAAALAGAGLRADYSVEITQDISSLIGPGEIVGVVVAAMVLLLTLGSLVASGLPILAALLGVAVGLAGALTASYFFTMNQLTPALALMLGLAVGIDYTLFIVNRHRTQILDGMPLTASIGRAVGTAGNAVIFAGSTVVIALAALVLSGMPILAQMGLVAAGTVAVAVVVAITLTPALLGLLGTRVVSRRAWRARGWAEPGELATRVVPRNDHEEVHGGWYVRLVTASPWLTMAGVVGLIAILALPALDLRLGLPDGGNEPRTSTARAAYDSVAESFGPGRNGPIVAVATMDAPLAQEAVLGTQADLVARLSQFDGVVSVLPVGVSSDRSTLAFQITTSSGPSDQATVETVSALRGDADTIGAQTHSTLGFTGQTVANIEISEGLAAALPLYLTVVIGLSLVILTLVFRSLVVPLVATGGFLLSVAAAFGATVAVHQWGWLGGLFGVSRPGPILSFLPTMLVGVLFGLAMDYQMFLVTGMAEARAHGESARRAVVTGFTHGAKVVTAAAAIMASVFGGFMFSHVQLVRPLGFALAVGVLVDAVLVRMTLTPALMHLLGERAWWFPTWLDRLLPSFDVEGRSLIRADEASAADRADAAETDPTDSSLLGVR